MGFRGPGLLLLAYLSAAVHAFGASQPASASLLLAWDKSPDAAVTGYRVHYGAASGVYSNHTLVGNVTNRTVGGLAGGATYFFAVTACTASGLESDYSNEAVCTIPSSSQPPTVALTLPPNGTSYIAPATIDLAASVTANGHTISTVRFYVDAVLLGEDATAPYSFVWSPVNAGTYSLRAQAVVAGGSAVDSSPVSVTVLGLPAPWQTLDLGTVSVGGSACVSNGLHVVQGAGNLSGLADNFRFVYQPLSGDGEIKARLISVGGTGENGRIGVIIRESLTSGSRYAWMGLSPSGIFRWQRRSSTGGATASSTSGTGTPPSVWARLVRSGNTFTGYRSTDGTNWTRVNSRNIAMAPNIYIGLAVASGVSNALNRASFANVTVIP
jgi:hypothetical protein